MIGNLFEKTAIKPIASVGSAAAGINTDRISMKNFDRLAILADLGASTGSTVTFAFKQHTALTGGVTKALALVGPYYKRVAGQATSKVTLDVAADTFDLSTDFAAAEGFVGFQLLAEDLDVNNGFSYVSVVINSGTAKQVAGFYIGGECRQLPGYLTAL